LVENDYGGRVQLSRIYRRARSYAKSLEREEKMDRMRIIIIFSLAEKSITYQRNVPHGVNDDSLMFGRVFGYPSEVGFDDVVSVQKRHFSIWFYPDLPTLGFTEYISQI
jgi:hypothetical protein